MRMKHILLIFFILILPISLFSQRDTVSFPLLTDQKELLRDAIDINVSIYPVPVRENTFTIKSDKEISSIKITNIIGQDIFRIKYSVPQFLSKIILENPRRGMYMVVIFFNDNTRIVKKVMIEGTY
jgi:hypothetical protein